MTTPWLLLLILIGPTYDCQAIQCNTFNNGYATQLIILDQYTRYGEHEQHCTAWAWDYNARLWQFGDHYYAAFDGKIFRSKVYDFSITMDDPELHDGVIWPREKRYKRPASFVWEIAKERQ